MTENNLKNIIEEIGKLLARLIHNSEELHDLLDKLREEGHQPVISFEAKLTLLKEGEGYADAPDEDGEEYEVSYEKTFDQLVTSDDLKFLDSIHIQIKKS